TGSRERLLTATRSRSAGTPSVWRPPPHRAIRSCATTDSASAARSDSRLLPSVGRPPPRAPGAGRPAAWHSPPAEPVVPTDSAALEMFLPVDEESAERVAELSSRPEHSTA